MVLARKNIYAKAYVELNELIKHLSSDDQSKIPLELKNNLLEKMDKDYTFTFDSEKSLTGQNFMPETKALFLNIYQKYLTDDTQLWENYDKICFNLIEEEKRKKYNPNNIFDNAKTEPVTKPEVVQTDLAVIPKSENFFTKLVAKIKNFFKLS